MNVITKVQVGGADYGLVPPAGLTEEQQAQARANIGAISAGDTEVVRNGTYPEMTVGNATNAQNADNAQNAVNATNAVNAQRATADGNGNNIGETYFTRQQIIDLIYPVGCRVVQCQGQTAPAAQFGGTWEIDTDYTGRVMVGSGAGYTLGATGGSADSVVVDHTHNASGLNEGTPATSSGDFVALGRRYSGLPNVQLQYTVSAKGESGVGKNMQPYKVVAVWKRTA